MASRITDFFQNDDINSPRSNVNSEDNQEQNNVIKRKRVLKKATVEKWINKDLAKDNGAFGSISKLTSKAM